MNTVLKIGLFGFGKTGKLVANELLNSADIDLQWVVRKSHDSHHKYASRLLGCEYAAGEIYSVDDLTNDFFINHPVDAIIDFSNSAGVNLYKTAGLSGTPIVSAISNYDLHDMSVLENLAKSCPVLYSPNITLGINVLIVAAQILQKIMPQADIEIVEEHFREKSGVSGTAKKIANLLDLSAKKHINSIRVGGIVGRHEIILGMPNQTIRLSHESINRAAFGQGAIFATHAIIGKPAGMYTMETIIAEMFRNNIPLYL
ncbi:MAG: 4-hydroxy-tetrahydrodipicolinate reductase [Selenomonadaceae bacterium]